MKFKEPQTGMLQLVQTKIGKSLMFWLFAALLLQSCIGNKEYIYLQDKASKSDSVFQNLSISQSYKLKPGDILYIRFNTDDEKMNAQFNPTISSGVPMQMLGGNGSPFYFMGYSIDGNGNLDFPYLGKIHAEGKSVDELKLELEKEARKYFKVFYVHIKLGEFRFSILGSVNRPGQYFFNVNHLNVLEAIAMAGDLHENARRTQITLLRQENGQTKLIPINLTDRNLLTSPYFQIQPNDIVYVQPVKSRSVGNISNFQSSLATILPIFSTFLTVLNTYIILQNLK